MGELYNGQKIWYTDNDYIYYDSGVTKWNDDANFDVVRESSDNNDDGWFLKDGSDNEDSVDNSSLTFKELRDANTERNKNSYDCGDWDMVDWTNALAGEVGELCNKSKKCKRDKWDNYDLLKEEVADIAIYVDLVANYFGFDLEECVKDKFNSRSEEIGSDVRL